MSDETPDVVPVEVREEVAHLHMVHEDSLAGQVAQLSAALEEVQAEYNHLLTTLAALARRNGNELRLTAAHFKALPQQFDLEVFVDPETQERVYKLISSEVLH